MKLLLMCRRRRSSFKSAVELTTPLKHMFVDRYKQTTDDTGCRMVWSRTKRAYSNRGLPRIFAERMTDRISTPKMTSMTTYHTQERRDKYMID